MTELAHEVRGLVRRLIPDADMTERGGLERLDQMFDEPLRIAIAGMIKSGKSTLLNALVGQRLAPTDAGECTRIVTWYGHGPRYEVTAVGFDGSRTSLRFERGDELSVDLAGRDHISIERLDVRWPSERLVGQQLVDTPGLGSLSRDVSGRTESFLTGEDDLPVDAVVYLLRHRHPADLSFLEAFHGGVASGGAMGAIGVLSRADELAGAQLDALGTASRVAKRLASDARIERLVQTVVPVAGLLAETAATVRNDELLALQRVGQLPEKARANVLLTADRFSRAEVTGLEAEVRTQLLDRFGIYGIRLAAQLVAEGSVGRSDELASALNAASGIGELRAELSLRFAQRSSALRARAALNLLTGFAVTQNDPDARGDIERIAAGAHELVELDLIDDLRRGRGGPLDRASLVRLFGGQGATAGHRLGLDAHADSTSVRQAATDALRRWQREAENPLASPEVVTVARAAIRTCEGLVVASA
ncbi:MAG: dynamin family protein [Actinomycetota bacterium]